MVSQRNERQSLRRPGPLALGLVLSMATMAPACTAQAQVSTTQTTRQTETAPASNSTTAPMDPAQVKALQEQLAATQKQLEAIQKQLSQQAATKTTETVENTGISVQFSKDGFSIRPASASPGEKSADDSAALTGKEGDASKVPPTSPELPAVPALPVAPVAPEAPMLPPMPALPTLPPLPGVPDDVRSELQDSLKEINQGILEAQLEANKASEEARSEAMKAALEAREEAVDAIREARDELVQNITEVSRELANADEEAKPQLLRTLGKLERELKKMDRRLQEADRDFERESRRINRSERRENSDGDDRLSFGDGAVVKAGETVKDLVVLKGDAEVFGTVDGDAVVMAGDLIIHDGGKVRGDAVVMGGEIDLQSGGILEGEKVRGDFHVPDMHEEESSDFGDTLGKGIFRWLLLMAAGLLAMTFIPARVQQMAAHFERKPLAAGMIGVLTIAALLPGSLLLAITLVGIPLVPVVWLLAGFSSVVGTVAIAQVVAQKLPLKRGPKSAAGMMGWGLLLLVLGTLPPVVGVLATAAISVMGLGAVVMSRFGNPDFEVG